MVVACRKLSSRAQYGSPNLNVKETVLDFCGCSRRYLHQPSLPVGPILVLEIAYTRNATLNSKTWIVQNWITYLWGQSTLWEHCCLVISLLVVMLLPNDQWSLLSWLVAKPIPTCWWCECNRSSRCVCEKLSLCSDSSYSMNWTSRVNSRKKLTDPIKPYEAKW